MLNSLKKEVNYTVTENGAVANRTTHNACLDFFGLAGAMRSRPTAAVDLFKAAYFENRALAVKLMFYFRDIRGGQGERQLFRNCLKFLATREEIDLTLVFPYISEHGRFDDFYALVGTTYESSMFEWLKKQLNADLKAYAPSLLAKWLKSENASSKETKALGAKTRKYFNMTPKEYRKTLSTLRNKINVLEVKMSAGKWDEIDFSKLPAKASLLYKDAFKKHEPVKYQAFIDSIQKGETAVKSATLYPYELVKRAMYSTTSDDKIYLNSGWDNLPDYLNGDDSRALAVIDVSGSMEGDPMNVSISLGLYMAERNKGHFHNHFLTFHEKPRLLEVKDTMTFVDKVTYIKRAPWGGSTNIEATFDLILSAAVNNNLTQAEMPETLFIISDMEFDTARRLRWGETPPSQETLMEGIANTWKSKGYEMPRLVFWNVNSRQNQFPTIKGKVTFISGLSPAIFTSAIKNLSAEEVMMEAIAKYSNITL